MNKQQVIEYIMTTPNDTNVNVLLSLLRDVEEIKKQQVIKYALTTPGNPNRRVLKALLDYEPAPSPEAAVVGTAVVGEAIVR